MVYMAAFNDLSPAANADLDELTEAGASDAVHVYAFAKQRGKDGGSWVRRMRFRAPGVVESEDLDDVDSADPRTFEDFVRWASGMSPAERYAFVIWNHGGGWRSDQADEAVPGGLPVAPEVFSTSPMSGILFSTSLRRLAESGYMTDVIANDDGTHNAIDTPELGRLVRALGEILGQPLDVLGMDACMMSNLEVAYELDAAVGIIATSEEEEPNYGWPYVPVLKGLHDDPDRDAKALGELIVAAYMDFYMDNIRYDNASAFLRPDDPRATQAALVPGDHQKVTQAFGVFADALIADPGANSAILDSCRKESLIFDTWRHEKDKSDLVDLSALCHCIEATDLLPASRTTARGLREALKPGSFVWAEGHYGLGIDLWGGLSIYLPPSHVPITRFYDDIRFAQLHRWDEVLRISRER